MKKPRNQEVTIYVTTCLKVISYLYFCAQNRKDWVHHRWNLVQQTDLMLHQQHFLLALSNVIERERISVCLWMNSQWQYLKCRKKTWWTFPRSLSIGVEWKECIRLHYFSWFYIIYNTLNTGLINIIWTFYTCQAIKSFPQNF